MRYQFVDCRFDLAEPARARVGYLAGHIPGASFLDLDHARRLVRLYGTLARTILGIARSHADLGQHFGDDLYEAEIAYLMDREWAMSSDDVLWRRTKRGLHGKAIDVAALSAFMAQGANRQMATG